MGLTDFISQALNLISGVEPEDPSAASKGDEAQRDRLYYVFQDALEFLSSTEQLESFHAGPSFAEDVNRRIVEVGETLEVRKDDPGLEFLRNEAAHHRGGLTEQARLEVVKQQVVHAIKIIRDDGVRPIDGAGGEA